MQLASLMAQSRLILAGTTYRAKANVADELSGAANDATKLAMKTGKIADHREAAYAHEQAAVHHRGAAAQAFDQKNYEQYNQHSAEAQQHQDKAQQHTTVANSLQTFKGNTPGGLKTKKAGVQAPGFKGGGPMGQGKKDVMKQ